MNPIATHLAVFLVGIVGGAAAAYYGELFSDRRREKEAEAKRLRDFSKVKSMMPELFVEMRIDLLHPASAMKREFFVCKRNGSPINNRKALTYHTDEHADLLDKVRILEEYGYVSDISPGTAPLFRMSEFFVEFIKEK